MQWWGPDEVPPVGHYAAQGERSTMPERFRYMDGARSMAMMNEVNWLFGPIPSLPLSAKQTKKAGRKTVRQRAAAKAVATRKNATAIATKKSQIYAMIENGYPKPPRGTPLGDFLSRQLSSGADPAFVSKIRAHLPWFKRP